MVWVVEGVYSKDKLDIAGGRKHPTAGPATAKAADHPASDLGYFRHTLRPQTIENAINKLHLTQYLAVGALCT